MYVRVPNIPYVQSPPQIDRLVTCSQTFLIVVVVFDKLLHTRISTPGLLESLSLSAAAIEGEGNGGLKWTVT